MQRADQRHTSSAKGKHLISSPTEYSLRRPNKSWPIPYLFTIGFMLQQYTTAIGLSLAFGFATYPVSASGGCPDPVRPSREENLAAYERIRDEVDAMGRPYYKLDFQIGDQQIFRARRRVDSSYPDEIAQRLRALKPRLERLLDEAGARSGRPVLIVESRTDTFAGSHAFTACENAAEGAAEGSISSLLPDMPVPNGACLMVIYPSRIHGENYLDFVLAHEWMHTRQHMAYGEAFEGGAWWREGSAEWFAHKVVPGFTLRDDVIERFFDDQHVCPLNKVSDYSAEVFFFWGEKAFDAQWVFEQGAGGQAWLRETSKAALLLPPERWLEWAKAQADKTITMPDGRVLPASAPIEYDNIGSACGRVTIEGPPLSVQLRSIEIPPGAEGPLRIETGRAQVALRQAGGDWVDVSGGATLDPAPVGSITIAAIQPNAHALSVHLSMNVDNVTDPASQCACTCARPVPACVRGHWSSNEAPQLDLLVNNILSVRKTGSDTVSFENGGASVSSADLELNVGQGGHFNHSTSIDYHGSGLMSGQAITMTGGIRSTSQGTVCLTQEGQICMQYAAITQPVPMQITAMGMTIPFAGSGGTHKGTMTMPYTCNASALTLKPTMQGEGTVPTQEVPVKYHR